MNNTPQDIPNRSGFTLIELLIVIAIIGILMSLLFPAVNSAIDAARKAQAKNDVTQIATAIAAYESEYGKLPGLTAGGANDETVLASSNGIIGTLMGTRTNENTRGITFLEVGTWKKGKGGLKTDGSFADPWGNPYQVTLDGNYDNTIEVRSGLETGAGSTNETLRKKVAVFNFETSDPKSSTTNYFRHAVKSW